MDARERRNAYIRERKRRIREGTWHPHSAPSPTVEPTPIDIAWAAGFIEGEGSFKKHARSYRIVCGQNDREPLDRLSALFGGSIRLQHRMYRGEPRPIFVWEVYGEKAGRAIDLIYPFLSARRREQADNARGA